MKLDAVVPFLLADKLTERGALHQTTPLWQKGGRVSASSLGRTSFGRFRCRSRD